MQKVNLDDILFIEGEGNYCTIHARRKKFVLKMSLKKILEELDKERFMPVHKRFIAQLDRIESLDLANNLLTVGDKQVPRSGKKTFDSSGRQAASFGLKQCKVFATAMMAVSSDN